MKECCTWFSRPPSVAVAIAAYLQALHYPFIGDDAIQISENTKLAKLPVSELWRLLTEPYNSMFEFLPLRDLSYWFDMTLFGLNPSAFRLHNILLYLLCLPLVYGTTHWLWRYFRPADVASASWAAATVTALFVLHPALVESVVWITGRKYVLPNLFSMLALWLAVNAKHEHGLSVPYATAALFAFAAVMLSKSSYIAVAPIIAMLWILFWRDIPAPNRKRYTLLWPLAILLLAMFMVRIFISKSEDHVPFYFGIEALIRSLAVLGWMARLAISPENHHYFYPVFEDPYLPAMVALGVAVLLAAGVGAVMIFRKRSLEGFALATFFLLSMPYIQLIPYESPSLVQDRYLSLAAWPAVMLTVALAWRLRAMYRTLLLLIIALSWCFQTVERPRDWRSFESLVDTDIRAYPGFYMPVAYRIFIAIFRQESIREASEAANNIASTEFRNIVNGMIQANLEINIATASKGNHQKVTELLWKLGLDLKQPPAQSKWNLPINHFWKKSQYILSSDWSHLAGHFPDDTSIFYSAGLWSLEIHYFDDAVTYLTAATQSQSLAESVRGTALKSLGLALMNSGHIAQAEAPLRAALTQSPPDLRAHCALSVVYRQTNRPEESARSAANCSGGAGIVPRHP